MRVGQNIEDWVNTHDSKDKDRIRELWYKYSLLQHEMVQRDLDFVWLAANNLYDINPILPYANSICIPENNHNAIGLKTKAINKKTRDERIKIVFDKYHNHLSDYMIPGDKYDVVNFDTCGHMHDKTGADIASVFSNKCIRDEGLFFLTLSRWSMAGCRDRITKEKPLRLAATMEEEVALVEDYAHKGGYYIDSLPFPFPYNYKSNMNRDMRAYGWRVYEII